MRIVGFSLTKSSIEKIKELEGKFKVTSQIDLKDVKEEKASPVQGQDVVRFDFTYNINYEPDFAKVNFNGFITAIVDKKETKNIIDNWKKNKSVVSDDKMNMFNLIFQKCNIKALALEEDHGLPPHIRLPTLKAEEANTSSKTSYTG